MKVQIREVIEDKEGVWVRLDSAVGLFWALWGDGRPNVGHDYHVELEVDRLLRLGQSVMATAATAFAIRGDDRSTPVVIVGRVTQVFREQGTVQIQVGDSVFDVELEGQVSPQSWIQLHASRLTAYNENY